MKRMGSNRNSIFPCLSSGLSIRSGLALAFIASVFCGLLIHTLPVVAAEEQCSLADASEKEREAYVNCVNARLNDLSQLNKVLTERLKTLVEQTAASQASTDTSIAQLRASKLVVRGETCAANEIFQYVLCLDGGRPDSNGGRHFCYPGQKATTICRTP